MGAGSAVTLLLGLLFAPGLYAQGVDGATASSGNLQPWLVGLAAVLGFLGVIFLGALVNRCFFSNKRGGEDEERMAPNIELRHQPLSSPPPRRARNAYDNVGVDTSDEEPSNKAKAEDEKLTSM